ncbi:lipopolysaccharide biosynthesis protein [Acidipropionibacterium virtanenii]|uniref:Teichuronic acid biosynthesis protein TuaB n=1 Tax=Acidipropionibacterium virtanenii TaxID=2057246 RepID=A0A344UWM3_9ACTN|nr:lipopolysaccharide biosynthesis protein [Acidipropionibacterium virtanenii]AXE39671.1 Teichuronic acid biosynthesis protein TuaB [Acidipropionibacterium virtanenii]
MFTLGAQGIKILLQLLSVVTLSRLLTPHDYGLLAIVLVIIGIGEIFRDFGLTSASVQAPELTDGQRDNLFWINTGIGVVLAALMYCSAWPVQAFMHDRELIRIVHVLSVTFVLNGLTTQYRAQLMRALRFRAMAVIDIIAATFSLGSAIVAALLGAGYWALVLQQIISCLVLLVGAAVAGRWMPRWYSRRHQIGSFVRFGWNLVGSNLLSYGGKQVDTLIVAGRFGTTSLGFYNRSYQLIMSTFSQIRSPLSDVAIPVMSRVQREKGRFNSYVAAGQITLGYGLGIPIALVAGLADPVVQIMLGSQWTQVAPYMRFFCGATLMSTLAFVGYWVYVSRGLGRQLFLYSLVEVGIRVVCIVVGSFFGMLGVAAGVFVEPLLSWSLSIYWLSRITPIPVRSLWLGGFRILGLTATVTAVSWLTASAVHVGAWLTLLAGVGAGAVAVLVFLILPAYRSDARELMDFIRLMIRRERTD